MRRGGSWLAAVAAAGAVATHAAAATTAAQDETGPGRPNFATFIPCTQAVRIAGEDAPVIDGDLSDPVWRRAQPIDEFYQVVPVEGGAPSQPTRAYILFDDRNLYIGIYNYDDRPDQIRRSQMRRDPALEDDDAVRILLDTFGSFRDSYFFGVNPNGARADALVENNSSFRDEWNTIWRAKASIVDDGWVAEIVIPFQSIAFDASLEEWNFQIVRTIRRNNEEIRWSNINRGRGRTDITNPGRLTGVRDVDSGAGLEVQAYVGGSASYDWITDETDYEIKPSGNVFYKITPSLTGSLTVNTDFSDTALDARQVNTGRFSLFFPETRDFFLQDAQVFEFGGRIFSHGQTNGLPFFSRNIGIVNGTPVDLVAGAKLSGKLGPANVGVISARTGSSDAAGVDGQFLSAARISTPVLSESKVGVIFTHGDPTGDESSAVAGADFQFKRSNVLGDGTFYFDTGYVRSFSDGESDHMIVHETAYRSQTWNSTFRFRDIGDDYAPKLGFVNRTGIRQFNVNSFRVHRPDSGFLRYAEIGGFANLITDRNGERLDQFIGSFARAENNVGDRLELDYEHGYVNIIDGFSVAGEVPVAPGEYRWNQYEIEVGATSARKIGGEVGVRWGGVYDGDLFEIRSELSLRPNRFIELAAEYSYSEFDLPSGQIGIHIAAIDSVIAFTPDMTIKTEVQYDNISEAFTFFSRFSWEPIPEREIFLSFGHTALIDRRDFPRDFASQGTSLALRLGHTFRM